MHECERALREAVESGTGFRDAAETEAASRWALAEVERLREALEAIRMDDFDRAIHPSAAALAGYVLNGSAA